MFGHKKAKVEAQSGESKPQERPEHEDADALMRYTLRTLDQSIALRREAREKTQRFVGSLRPLAKAR
jgi:chorismate synthase